MHATLFRIVGSNQGMDDLVQETFLQVFRSLHSYRGESRLASWIDRCAVRVVYASFGAKKRHGRHLELVTEIASDDPSQERRAMAREAARRLYVILDALDAKQRVAFSLHALDGHPVAEVAHLMDATVIATKTRIWRARQFVESRAAKDPLLKNYVSAGAPIDTSIAGEP